MGSAKLLASFQAAIDFTLTGRFLGSSGKCQGEYEDWLEVLYQLSAKLRLLNFGKTPYVKRNVM